MVMSDSLRDGEPLSLRHILSHELTHDLKAPLATIMGYLNLIEGDIEDRQFDSLQESLCMIARATRTTGDQIDALRRLASIAELDEGLKQVSVEELLKEAEANLALNSDFDSQPGISIEINNCHNFISLRPVATTFAFEQFLREINKWTRSGGDHSGGVSPPKEFSAGRDCKDEMMLKVCQESIADWTRVKFQVGQIPTHAKEGLGVRDSPRASLTDSILRSLMALHGGRMEGAVLRRPPIEIDLYFPLAKI